MYRDVDMCQLLVRQLPRETAFGLLQRRRRTGDLRVNIELAVHGDQVCLFGRANDAACNDFSSFLMDFLLALSVGILVGDDYARPRI